MTHSMVTGQSTCQAAAQTYNSQTDRDVGVSTLGSTGVGEVDWQGELLRGDILHTNWTTGPPSWFHSLSFSFRHPGSGSKTPFHVLLSLQSLWNFVVKLQMFPALCF